MSAPANQFLSLTNVINVTVVSPGAQLAIPNMSAIAIFTREQPSGWAGGQQYAVYTSPDQVATDFGITSSMYAMAVAIFSQNPNILTGGGFLVIVPRESGGSELVTAAIARVRNLVPFAGVLIDIEMDNDATNFALLAAYCQAQKLIFGYCSSDVADLQPNSILDLARQAGDTYTRCMYYGNDLVNGADVQQTQIFAAAYLSRGMSIDFNGAGTVLSMQLQTLTGITPDQTIAQTQYLLAQTAGVDIYASVSGVPCVLTSGANLFFDQVYCRTWIQFQLQVNGFNYLKNAAQVPGKIPQTEAGMTGLKTAYASAFIQGITNGYLAPGSWTAPFTFGNPADFAANILAQGWYMVSQPVVQQTTSARDAREAPLVQAAIKEAGAVHSSNVIVYVNP